MNSNKIELAEWITNNTNCSVPDIIQESDDEEIDNLKTCAEDSEVAFQDQNEAKDSALVGENTFALSHSDTFEL